MSGRERLKKQIDDCSEMELQMIERVIKAYKTAGEQNLHFMAKFLGINRMDEDTFYMSLGLQNQNRYGMTQGGATYTLADIALGYKIIDHLKEGQKTTTLEMKMNY